MKNFVSYTLGGNQVNEEISRRFSDFYTLREKLIERWPGVYVPNIPPKKTIGNTGLKIIDKRIRLLNKFCYQLSHIYSIQRKLSYFYQILQKYQKQ